MTFIGDAVMYLCRYAFTYALIIDSGPQHTRARPASLYRALAHCACVEYSFLSVVGFGTAHTRERDSDPLSSWHHQGACLYLPVGYFMTVSNAKSSLPLQRLSSGDIMRLSPMLTHPCLSLSLSSHVTASNPSQVTQPASFLSQPGFHMQIPGASR